ncbi:hypothetical protein [Saccharopolyspora cebuensis]|uniref:hypothetical protein n=1 Tax=Saccharopolyspora cebuensis TaxID=418759 RepID=UPI0031E722A2
MDAEQARDEIRHARQQLTEAEDAAAQAREDFHSLIAEVMRDRALPRDSELVDLTGYRREHLRRIARAAGVPPRR